MLTLSILFFENAVPFIKILVQCQKLQKIKQIIIKIQNT